MNIAQLLIPKSSVAVIYDDATLRQGMEKLRYHKYTAIPVITRDNHYVGTVSEGDFLWYFFPTGKESLQQRSLRTAEEHDIRDILIPDRNPPLRIDSPISEVFSQIMRHNFVPVVDDRDTFCGIVTRRSILRHFYFKTRNKNTESNGISPNETSSTHHTSR